MRTRLIAGVRLITPFQQRCRRATGPAICFLVILIAACVPKQFTTATLYDSPHAFVRLEADPATGQGAVHSHPATVAPDQIAAVLHGMTIEEPKTRMPIYDDMSIPRHHRAFDENTIAFLAPLLSLGLAQATPEEVVTFYLSKDRSGGSREITSGGVFVHGEELHFVLANYRSPTNYMSDFGAADTMDDRLTPMRSRAPQRGRLGFEPASAVRVRTSNVFSRMFQAQERELIIAFKELTPYRLDNPPSSSLPANRPPPAQ